MQNDGVGQLNSNIQAKLINLQTALGYRSPTGKVGLEQNMHMFKFYFSYAFTTPTIPT